MTHALRAAVLAVGLLSSVSGASALEPFVPYATFDDGRIDPERFVGNDSGEFNPADGGADVPAVGPTTAIREVVNGELHLALEGFARQDSNIGQRNMRNHLRFVRSHQVTAMKARFRATKLNITGCDANANSGAPFDQEASVRIQGNFFNTGQPGTNDLGDVSVSFGLTRAPGEAQVIVRATLSECTGVDANGVCTASNNNICKVDEGGPGTGTTCARDLGVATLGQNVTLAVAWDEAAGRVQVQRGNLTPVLMTYKDTRPNAGPPHFNGKSISAAADVPNCVPLPGEKRPKSVVDLFIDNVEVNASAAGP